MYILLWAQCLQAPLHTVSVAAGVCPQMQSGTNNKCIIISLLWTGKVLLPFLSDPLPFLSFYFLFLYMDNWSKSLEILNKWMVCYTGFPLGSFAEGNIYSKGTWTFRCHGWHCWLFRESCSAGMFNSRWNRFLFHCINISSANSWYYTHKYFIIFHIFCDISMPLLNV